MATNETRNDHTDQPTDIPIIVVPPDTVLASILNDLLFDSAATTNAQLTKE